MGQFVLSSQFAANLVPELKSKVAGVEGDLEKLLTKAHFEEAKLRNLTEASPPDPSPHQSDLPPSLTEVGRSPIHVTYVELWDTKLSNVASRVEVRARNRSSASFSER